MAAAVKLTKAEALALVAALEAGVGTARLLAALASALPADKVASLVVDRAAVKLTRPEKIALIKAIVPLIPGETPQAKILWCIKSARRAFETEDRFKEVMAYVVERIKAHAAGGTGPASTSLPVLGKGTIFGYGPVNRHLEISEAVIRKILDRMQSRNVRYFVVEAVGHAKNDVLGSPAKLASCKARLKFEQVECLKRGIAFAPIFLNDNAGKSTWNNGGPALSKRLPQAKDLLAWAAENLDPANTWPTLVAETRTSAGAALENYAAPLFKARGFRIGNNHGSRAADNATFGGARTDFPVYHPTKANDWPANRRCHIVSDTGAILAQLNQGGNVYGKGNPAAISAWRQQGAALGFDVVAYYGFDVAEYDEAAIDAMGEASSAQPEPVDGWPAELSSVTWLHTNVRNWPATAKMTASVAGGLIQFPYDKANAWPVATSGTGKGTNANVWAIVNIAGRWYAGTFEWLRKGQTSKPTEVLDRSGGKGDHFKVSPLNKWVPKSGERFYVMVSGHARMSERNVKERSDPVKVTWP